MNNHLLTQSSFQHRCLQTDCTPINAPSACCGKQGANFHTVASFCPVINVVFRLHVLIRRRNTALGARPCKPTEPLETHGAQRGFSWALLSWHCFHPREGTSLLWSQCMNSNLTFPKLSLSYIFFNILFLSRGPKPLNQRQFCFPSCQQYFGYFKNVGQG